jgi:hypothetical protein
MSDEQTPEQQAVTMYLTQRLSVLKVHQATGVPEKKLREILRADGLLRKVGQQPRSDLDPVKIRAMRKRHKMSWEQIAQGVGASKNAVIYAYRQAYGDNGDVDLHSHLTGVQRGELGHLWDTLPRAANEGHDLQSREARALFDLVAFHHKRGVTYEELGEAIGITAVHLGRCVRDSR